jgi:MraZ protein
MLIGQYNHNIDIKGRVFFPAKFRDDLGETFVVTRGLDNCLFVYSFEEWTSLEQKIKNLPLSKARDLQRFLFSGACEVNVDKQGRILIPANLREHAGLTKEATVVGVSNRCEIWSTEKWEKATSSLEPDAIALAMEELGF